MIRRPLWRTSLTNKVQPKNTKANVLHIWAWPEEKGSGGRDCKWLENISYKQLQNWGRLNQTRPKPLGLFCAEVREIPQMLLLVTLVPPFKWTENIPEHRVSPARGELAHEYLSSLPNISRYFCNLSTLPFHHCSSSTLFHRGNILITCHTSTWPDLVLEPREFAIRWKSFSKSPKVSQLHFLP